MKNFFKKMVKLFKKEEKSISELKYPELIKIKDDTEKILKKFFGERRFAEIVKFSSTEKQKKKALSLIEEMNIALKNLEKELENAKDILSLRELREKYGLSLHAHTVLKKSICMDGLERDLDIYCEIINELKIRREKN